jgi:hypothetical protein
MTFATRNVGAARHGLAILHVFLTGITLAAMMVVHIPEGNKDILLLLVGALVGNSGIIIGWYFGSNRRGVNGS